MNKLSYLLVAVLLIASACEKKRTVANLPGDDQLPPVSENEQALQSNIRSIIEDNISDVGGEDYKFGQVGEKTELVFDKLKQGEVVGQVAVRVKEKTKECKIDLSKKMKIQYKNCESVSGCKIALSATKVCKMRPLFLVKPNFTEDELKNCKAKAYIKSVLALKKELLKNDDEAFFSKIESVSTSFVSYLKKNSIHYSIGDASSSVIKIDIEDRSKAVQVCLDKLIQNSAYSQNIADKGLSKAQLEEIKAINPDAKGGSRINKANIAVFKIELELVADPNSALKDDALFLAIQKAKTSINQLGASGWTSDAATFTEKKDLYSQGSLSAASYHLVLKSLMNNVALYEEKIALAESHFNAAVALYDSAKPRASFKALQESYDMYVKSAVSYIKELKEEYAKIKILVPNTFKVTLVSIDVSKRISVIKAIRIILPAMSLKEAKDLVDAAPSIVKKDVSNEESAAIRDALILAGATEVTIE